MNEEVLFNGIKPIVSVTMALGKVAALSNIVFWGRPICQTFELSETILTITEVVKVSAPSKY